LIKEKKRTNPKEVKVHKNKLNSMAELIKFFATGENRPENGAFVGFDFSMNKRGKVALPQQF
jgi:hypothetical protein